MTTGKTKKLFRFACNTIRQATQMRNDARLVRDGGKRGLKMTERRSLLVESKMVAGTGIKAILEVYRRADSLRDNTAARMARDWSLANALQELKLLSN